MEQILGARMSCQCTWTSGRRPIFRKLQLEKCICYLGLLYALHTLIIQVSYRIVRVILHLYFRSISCEAPAMHCRSYLFVSGILREHRLCTCCKLCRQKRCKFVENGPETSASRLPDNSTRAALPQRRNPCHDPSNGVYGA